MTWEPLGLCFKKKDKSEPEDDKKEIKYILIRPILPPEFSAVTIRGIDKPIDESIDSESGHCSSQEQK